MMRTSGAHRRPGTMLLLRQHTSRRACREDRDTLTGVPAFTLGRDDVRDDGSVYQ
jgi:hypothetical protein